MPVAELTEIEKIGVPPALPSISPETRASVTGTPLLVRAVVASAVAIASE
jgi:hypothetical protein